MAQHEERHRVRRVPDPVPLLAARVPPEQPQHALSGRRRRRRVLRAVLVRRVDGGEELRVDGVADAPREQAREGQRQRVCEPGARGDRPRGPRDGAGGGVAHVVRRKGGVLGEECHCGVCALDA